MRFEEYGNRWAGPQRRGWIRCGRLKDRGELFLGQVVQVFSNPRAGRHSRRKVAALARALEARGATVLLSQSADGAPRIAEHATHVCVAGGDGTVRHVADAVLRDGRAVTMSIFPTGTVNLLAMEVGYPRAPEAFAEMVLTEGARRRHYPVEMGVGHFFACAGVGPDSLAVAGVSPRLKRMIGRLAYVVAGARLLIDWPRDRIDLRANGRTTTCEAFYVAKGRYYAGRLSFARQARVDEPVLHVVALRRARRRDYLRFAATLALGRDIDGLANVEAFTCTTLNVNSGRSLPIQADGDIVGALPATLAVRPAPLLFC
jgi:diacylglycerol kinase (ATP)